MTTEEEDSVYPIAVLIDELRIEDVGPRINSLRRLPVIAKALGTERTISELIPYLTDSIDDAEDEVLLVMAEEIGKLVPFVGGPQYAPSLLLPLENLCNVEESAVRDKAVASLNNIAKDLPLEQLHNDYVKMVRRLASSDWATARAASCHLFSTLSPRLPEPTKSEIREIYKKLCHDEEPMVRRSACVNLKNIASVTDKAIVLEFLVPIFIEQSKDEQDSVRLLSVENSFAMSKSFGNIEQVLQHILPVVRGYGNDKSWRVRYMFADHFTSICSALGDEVTSSEMVNAFLRLTADSEAEVRTSVACKVYDFCSLLRVEKVAKEILPAVQKLATDQSQHVRAALAGVVMKLAPLIGREYTTTQLLPLFLTLLKDDYPDVRLNLISKLDAVNEVIGVETLSRNLLPAVVKLAEDKQWRVRLAIINEIPILASQFGVSFFDEQLMDLCMNWLSDKVYEIRLATTEILKRLTELFGVEWARSKLIPKVLQLTANRNYLYRMTVLFAIKQMATVVNRDIVQQQLLPAVLKLANDPVPNIRFNCCKTLEILLPNVTDSTPVKATLTKLHDDPDVDVRFFAGQALTHC